MPIPFLGKIVRHGVQFVGEELGFDEKTSKVAGVIAGVVVTVATLDVFSAADIGVNLVESGTNVSG